MQDIFREADLSPGAVYSYFKGKDELIAGIIAMTMSFVGETGALVSEPLPEGRAAQARRGARRDHRPLSGLRAGHRGGAGPHLPPPGGRAAAQPATQRRHSARHRALRAGFETLALAAQERGELDSALDTEEFSRLPISLMQGLLVQIGIYGEELDIDAYARVAAAMIDGHAVASATT